MPLWAPLTPAVLQCAEDDIQYQLQRLRRVCCRLASLIKAGLWINGDVSLGLWRLFPNRRVTRPFDAVPVCGSGRRRRVARQAEAGCPVVRSIAVILFGAGLRPRIALILVIVGEVFGQPGSWTLTQCE